MRVARHPLPQSPILPALLRVLVVLLALAIGGFAAPNAQEAELADYLVSASGQQRPFLKYDPTLNQVARERAQDMARRDYFAHVDPDGKGPNYHVEQAGYPLPAEWPESDSANYIESIAAGRPTADQTWSDFMGSAPHKKHLLAEDPFYQEQTSYGIGYAYDAGSKYRHYWVVITAPPRPVPTLKITSPNQDARLKSDSVEVTGTAGGPVTPQEILARIENASGNTAFVSASGTANWRVTLNGLQPGVNTIRVRSLNANGGTIAEVARKVRYVVLVPLTIAVNGSGTVTSGFLGMSQRELGMPYTVVAKPSPGYLFSGWTGDMTGPNPAVSFTMPDSLSLVANFVPNPFIAYRGNYSGFVSGGNASVGGLITAKLTQNGRVSGKLRLGSMVSPFLAQLGVDGTGIFTVKRKNLPPLTVQLSLDSASHGLIASITDGTSTFTSAINPVATRSELRVRTGTYAVEMQPGQTVDPAAVPQGTGHGTVRVNRMGRARIVAVLADGQKFVHAGPVTEGGKVCVYSPLYSNGGFVGGELQFRPTESSDVDGLLNWRKPPQTSDPAFPDGFVTTVPVIGSFAPSPVRKSR